MSDVLTIAGRYTLESEIARGGIGVVYGALDASTSKRVALKRLLSTAVQNRNLIKLFEREYHTLVQLQHPRIIEVYDYGLELDGPYYTMEFLEGRDLRELAPLHWRDSCRHLRDVASSLALLHARRLIHRDVSPRNVRLNHDGRAKLLDFGAVATFGVSGELVGTPPMVPPEALNGQALDQRADLYSLGALAYWLLTGRHAYSASSLETLPDLWTRGAPVAPSKLVDSVPRELDQLVMGLLDVEVMGRPYSAAEIIERLNAIAGDESEEVVDVGHSYLSNPKIVGRDRELEILERFVDRVVGGHSASLVIEGEAGVGKTRLIEELAVAAQLKGATVLRADAEMLRGRYAVARGLAAAMITALPRKAMECAEPHVTVLGHVVSELRDQLRDKRLEAPNVDRSEQRLNVQMRLGDWFMAVASERPLVLVVENAQAADEASLALCVSLPRRGMSSPIGVVLTHRAGEEVIASRTFETIREHSGVLTLAPLNAAQTIALVQGLFGGVDNAGRLGRWLRDRTDGNPMQCLTLAMQLITDGLVNYKDGTWLLPAELSQDRLPSGMRQIHERRVAELSDGARRLAEAVSIERGKFSIEQCEVLAGEEGDDLFVWLDELVQKEILVGIEDGYRFSQTALKHHLRTNLEPDRQRELHRRAGECLLKNPNAEAVTRIDAAWHLLHAGQELRGADILAKVGDTLVSSIEGMALAAPGFEVTLTVLEKHGRSRWALLGVLDSLTSAGWYVDRRYAMKYGRRTLELAMELSGLALATRLAPVLGPRLALKVGIGYGALRHRASRKDIDVGRLQNFRGVFMPLIGTLGIMIGVSANTLDADLARKYLYDVRILKGFPEGHVIAVMYDYARYYAYVTQGRIAEARSVGIRVLEWFQSEPARRVIGADAAKALAGGQMCGLAMYTALTGTDGALEWAAKLEQVGLSFYSHYATQVRFVYHALRGEISKASPYREQLELSAIEGGTTWQTSILVPAMLGIGASFTGEVVRLRQSAEELDAMAKDFPSLALPVQVLRASYHYWRGMPEAALPLLEDAISQLPPNEHQLWAHARAVHARALLAMGRAQDALIRCRDAIRQQSPMEANNGMLQLEIHLALALAEAETGDCEGAAKRLDALLAHHEPVRVPLVLALLHDTRARVALLSGELKAFDEHADAMGGFVRATENSALIGKWQQLLSDGRDHFAANEDEPRISVLGPSSERQVSDFRTVTDEPRNTPAARRWR